MTENERNWLRLHLTPGLGRVGLMRLIRHFGSPAAALAAPSEDWTRQAGIRQDVARRRLPGDDRRFQDSCELLDTLQVRILSRWDDCGYPELLRQIPDPPALLYLRGTLPEQPALAVVGARRASRAGLQFTRRISSELAGLGVCIVSGLARGIDTAAHLGALDAAGTTIAVLGCGIDRFYPPENRELGQTIAASGAVLSEYPPGVPPLAGHFPGRNRLISGLSSGVLVVEAAPESGSLITVEFALEQGREVFAVPGSVAFSGSGGVNQLLKDGARLVTETRDVTDVLWPQRELRRAAQAPRQELDELPEQMRNILKNIDLEPLHIDELSRKSALTPMELSDILLHLELAGCIEKLPGARYVRLHTG